MTERDNIIDLVTQVDMAFLKRTEPWNTFDKYEAFAKLVAAAERKRITDLIRSERYGIGSMCSQWTDEEVAQDIEHEMKDSKEKP